MIHFEGDRPFRYPLSHVYGKISDLNFLVSCLHGAEDVVVVGQNQARWKIHPNLSFVRTTLEITMEIIERVPDSRMKVRIFSRGIGATSTVETGLEFRATDAGAAIHWSADILELTGLLKLMPKGLIHSSAAKVIDDTWGEIEKKLT